MATQDERAHAGSAAVAGGSGTLVEYEEFIETQLRKTRSHVRGVDLAGTLLILVTGTLAFFFVAGIVDHWVVPGGLGFWGRLTLLCSYLVGVSVYLMRQVFPLVMRRINPLYAAQTIERSRPSLKNALINFLLFREDHTGMPQVVYEAIEEQAAVNLATVHVESAVDRSKLIRIGYALVGVLVICALYTLLSPKDLFRTAGRVAMPWAGIDPPTSTTIQEIEPGDLQTFRGQQVNIKARIDGLADGGKARVVYSTADGQVIDRAVDMSLPTNGYKYAALLPSGDAKLQQSLTYRVEAGDAVSREYRVVVSAAPAIDVREVVYKYPAYTGLVAQRVADQGDLKAIEGTEITIRAVANEPIASAVIDFDCDNKFDQRMHVNKEEAQASFTATLKPDRSGPAYQCYQLLFKNERGEQNPQPVRHQIEITRDLAPEVQFVAPQDEEVAVPLDGSVDLEVVANDPDFALRWLRLVARVEGKPVVEKVLLDEAWRGQCVKKFRFEPGQLGLKEGDLVEYLATAEDNKEPHANRVETAPRRLRVVSAENRGPNADKMAKGNQRGQGQQSPKAGDKSDDGEQRPPSGNADNQKDQKSDARVADRRAGQSDQPPGAKQDDSTEPRNEPQAVESSPSAPQEGSRDGDAQGSDQGSGRTQGERSGDDSPAADQSVPTDGSNDREAIERILEHQNDQSRGESRPDSQQSSREGGDRQDQTEQGKTNPQSSDANGDASQQGGEKSGSEKTPSKSNGPTRGQEDAQQDGEPSGKHSGQDSQSGGDQRPDSAGSKQKGRDAGGREQASDKRGESSKSNQPGLSAKDSPKPSDSSKSQESRGGDNKADGDSAQNNKDGQGDHAGSETPAQAHDAQSGKPSDNSSQEKQGSQGGSDKGASDKLGDDSTSRQSETGLKPGEKTEQSKSGQAAKGNRDKQDSVADDKRGTDKGKSDPTSKGTEQPTEKSAEKSADNVAEDGDKGSDSGEKARDKSNAGGGGDKQSRSAQDGTKQEGQQGGGQSSKQDRPSPEPQGANQPRSKSPKSSPNRDDRPNPNGAQSPSTSEKQSDSEGREDGDRSGGGKQGGGQKAKKPGQGGAGQNSPSDDGAGRAEEPGKGETSAGQHGDQPSGEKSPTHGSQPGKGSNSASSKDGSSPGADDDKPDDSPPSGQGQQDDALRPGHNVRPGAPGSQSSSQPTGGKPSANQSADQPWQPGQEVAEKANLEYARKATDLALAHLKDELKNDQPDPQLLERLGWSKEDLENFVRRWEQMRSDAQTAGAKGKAARRDLDEALLSLGLRPRATSIKNNAAHDDKSQGYKESRRTSPPPEYAEQYKAYTQGTAKGTR